MSSGNTGNTEVKHVFSIEITTEIIEPFTWGYFFYHTEDDKCLGCVGKKILFSNFQDNYNGSSSVVFSDEAKSYQHLARNANIHHHSCFYHFRLWTRLWHGSRWMHENAHSHIQIYFYLFIYYFFLLLFVFAANLK